MTIAFSSSVNVVEDLPNVITNKGAQKNRQNRGAMERTNERLRDMLGRYVDDYSFHPPSHRRIDIHESQLQS